MIVTPKGADNKAWQWGGIPKLWEEIWEVGFGLWDRAENRPQGIPCPGMELPQHRTGIEW